MRANTKIWMALGVVFLSGVIGGFFGGQIYLHWRVQVLRRAGPAALQQFLLRRLDADLHLNADQIPAVEGVVGRAVQDLEAMRHRHGIEIWGRVEQTLSEVRPTLSPEQQKLLDGISVERLLPGPEHRPPR